MPGKIYDLSDLDNFELPPLTKPAKKEEAAPPSQPDKAENSIAGSPAQPVSSEIELPPLPPKKSEDKTAPTAAAAVAGDFELPPLPVHKPAGNSASAPVSEGNDTAPAAVSNASAGVSPGNISLDDFDLPPLPVRKPAGKEAENVSEQPSAAPAAADSPNDFELPPLPEKKPENANETVSEDGFDLPPLPEKKPENANETVSEGDGFDLPPLPEKKPDEPENSVTPEPEAYDEPEPEYEDAMPEPEKPKPRVSLEDDLDVDLETVTPEDIGIDDPSKALAPMRTEREAQTRNVREKMKMNDLMMDMEGAPVLDDLSDEYAAPEKRAEDLLERDHLESDEKQVLKQRLQEDLSRRPENYNARASRNMYNKLMEEKKLKIARKGMMISFIPILMELIAAGICFFTMNWGAYQWLSYVSVFGAFGALLLLIKSKHTKMFSIIISAVTVLAYAVPGLALYALDDTMQTAPDYVLHITLAAAAALLNIGSILILTKNEAVNTYYTAKFKRK